MKSFSVGQIPLMERGPNEPVYFVHVYMSGETLYFSDRNFKFNDNDYEAYLFDIPETAQSVEKFGGYRNINAKLSFWNKRFRSYEKLIDYFIANPLARREMELFVLYLDNGQMPDTDVSTRLNRLSFGEFDKIMGDTFSVELFSILHMLDSKKLFTQINRMIYPNADPKAIGQFENILFGNLKGIQCPCIQTGATSTLFSNLSATANEVYLSDIEYPMSFPVSGTIQIDEEKMSYTGKDPANKKLTGLTRGVTSTLAIEHKAGAVVWVIQSSYKYLAAGHQMKSIADVYVSGIRLPTGDYTVNLDDGGKTTITLTKKALNKHGHGQKSIYQLNPSTAVHETIIGTIVWWSGTGGAVDQYMKDKDQDTEVHFGYTGVIPEQKTGDFVFNFPAYNGDAADSIYVCAVVDADLIAVNGDYFKLNSPEQINIGDTGGKQTLRIKLTTTTVPTQIRFRGNAHPVGAGGNCVIIVYEAWLEIERWSVNPSGSPGDVLAPVVTIDGEGYQDDGSGAYTGVASALIENPSDVRRHLLIAKLGRTSADIGTSFGDMRTTYNGRVSPYKLAMNLIKIGSKPSEIFQRIDEQTRSQMREDGGKFELSFHPGPNGAGADFLPTNGVGISASGYWGSNTPNKSCDDSDATLWNGRVAVFPEWVQHDSGGVARIAEKLTIKSQFNLGNYRVKNFSLMGSNDGVNYNTIFTGRQANNGNVQSYVFQNTVAYRYHRLWIFDNWNGGADAVGIIEWELMTVSWSAPSEPTPVMTIDKTIFIGEPVFKMTPSVEIKNILRAVYDLDYGSRGDRRKFGDYFGQVELSDSGSIAQYGELPGEITFPAVRNAAMVEDVLRWMLAQKKDVIPIVSLKANRMAAKLERGDYFTLNDCPIAAWNGSLWKVLSVHPRYEQTFAIQAIKYVGS